jgi:hypothetical protein
MAILITNEGGLLEFEDRETVNRVCEQYEFEGSVLEGIIEKELCRLGEEMMTCKRGQGPTVFKFWRFVLCGPGQYTPCYLED